MSSHSKEYWAAWREKNRQKIRDYQRDYYYKNLERSREETKKRARKYRASGKAILQDRHREFGISPVKQLHMWEAQKGLCALCQTELNFRKAHLDHCHETGRVRGFLCASCNKGLGFFKDSPTVLRAAISYLQQGQ